ncbi:hypothetical protein ACRALDRAFT_2019970 [Sodiomyces alcalophilus JCM 7366]|uniref:uncharacterized protein n=1 Tax=Sodiomyces alcalophilus JCM 7366 TaxID=591952 RepID=UPI0039B65033
MYFVCRSITKFIYLPNRASYRITSLVSVAPRSQYFRLDTHNSLCIYVVPLLFALEF